MKDFAHPGTGAPEPADINSVVQNAITLCRSRHKNVVSLQTDFDPHVPPVVCRQGQIQQVMVNLIVNAVEAIEEQGIEGGIVRVETKSGAGVLRIAVSDNGPGIPSDVLPRIWEVYFSTKEKGTGLGLPTVRRILAEHGGDVTVSSRHGKGTTFSVFLPVPPNITGTENLRLPGATSIGDDSLTNVLARSGQHTPSQSGDLEFTRHGARRRRRAP